MDFIVSSSVTPRRPCWVPKQTRAGIQPSLFVGTVIVTTVEMMIGRMDMHDIVVVHTFKMHKNKILLLQNNELNQNNADGESVTINKNRQTKRQHLELKLLVLIIQKQLACLTLKYTIWV